MERWMVLVPLVSLSAFAQERPKVPDKAQQIAVQNALRALELATREPGQPIATAAIPSTCAVPLIEVPLNKNIDPKFERKVPAGTLQIPTVTPMPTCDAKRWGAARPTPP